MVAQGPFGRHPRPIPVFCSLLRVVAGGLHGVDADELGLAIGVFEEEGGGIVARNGVRLASQAGWPVLLSKA